MLLHGKPCGKGKIDSEQCDHSWEDDSESYQV